MKLERNDDFLPFFSLTSEWNNCTFLFGACSYTFSYSEFIFDETGANHGPDEVFLHLHPDETLEDRKRNCPKDPDLIGIVLGVIGAIVGVGLVTIFMWKAFTTIHDRREFAKFEQERLNMKFSANSNPIFKQATTTIQNPTFNPHAWFSSQEILQNLCIFQKMVEAFECNTIVSTLLYLSK